MEGRIEFACDAIVEKQEYKYRGEGNAHLALALKNKQILLIKKQKLDGKINEIDYDIEFYNRIMKPFLGRYLDDIYPVVIDAEEGNKLVKILENLRPAIRKHKDIVYTRATLFRDYAYLSKDFDDSFSPTYSIELKPKQGFTVLGSKCSFCCKQEQKLSSGRISDVSSYCPLDLYSGDEKRMSKAINSLVENPQNNMQISKDGELLYGEKVPINCFYAFLKEFFQSDDIESELFEEFVSTLRSILLTDLLSRTTHDCVASNESSLPKHCVLNQIYELQLYDHIGFIPGLCSEASYIEKFISDVENDTNNCSKCVMMQYLNSRSEIIDGIDRTSITQECKMQGSNARVSLKDEIIDIGVNYPSHAFSIPHYISKLARDCSIMIAVKHFRDISLSIPKENILRSAYGDFVFDVKVFDLFPKPVIMNV